MTLLSTDLRILALDYGTIRIGMALSDPLHIFATGIGTLIVDNDVLSQIKDVIEKNHVHLIVVGMPYTLRGDAGETAQQVLLFIERLREVFHGPIETYDERFTSSMAEKTIRELGIPKMKRREKAKVDEMSAVLLLQSYLSAQR
jgi:putative holliday junction resolvase